MKNSDPAGHQSVRGDNAHNERKVCAQGVYYVLLIGSLCLLIHGIYFSHAQRSDERYLRETVLPAVSGTTEVQALLDALGAAFRIPPHRGPASSTSYNISHPILSALGPPASLIHQQGRHCGRRARLLISILELKGIPAHKVHLINTRFTEFNHSHMYVHAVREAKINGRLVIADPLYNIVFQNNSGELASLAEIQREPGSVFKEGINLSDTRFSPYYSELYNTYDDYRKFIWNSFPFGEPVYEWLESWLGDERARELTVLPLIERPLQAIVAASYAGATVLASNTYSAFQYYRAS